MSALTFGFLFLNPFVLRYAPGTSGMSVRCIQMVRWMSSSLTTASGSAFVTGAMTLLDECARHTSCSLMHRALVEIDADDPPAQTCRDHCGSARADEWIQYDAVRR